MPEETEDSQRAKDEPPTDDKPKADDEEDSLLASERKIEELTDVLKRTQAEFENYKKRVERDAANRSHLASERLISDLLSVLDTLDSAIAGPVDETSNAGSKDGLDGIRKQFAHALRRAGVMEIDAEGQFDPFVHEAMMREESDALAEGRIIEVFQKGYMLGPKVVRTAKVKVSAGPHVCTREDDDDHVTDQDEEEPGREGEVKPHDRI